MLVLQRYAGLCPAQILVKERQQPSGGPAIRIPENWGIVLRVKNHPRIFL